MIKDITIGQFFPGNSIIHRLDPRIKILISIIFIVILFIIKNPYELILSIILTMIVYKLSSIPIKLIKNNLKPILPIIFFTAILNIFFLEGEVILKIGYATITKEGIAMTCTLIIRIISMIIISSLLTYTTSPIELTDAIERLMSPLKKIKFPAHELAMMMTIALRFIPTLIQETDKIIAAQKARGAKLDTGKLMERAKSLIPIVVPLFISAFRAADELATAMECRCYNGGKNRTKMKQLKLTKIDFIALGLSMIYILGILIIK